VVTISCGHHDSFSSFSGAAWEVAVLRLLHLFLRFISYQRHSFSCSLSHASLKCIPQCGSLNHVMDAAKMIGCSPLVYDHVHIRKVRVPMKQPRDTDKKRGIAIPQYQEHGPSGPREVSSILTIIVGLRRHSIPTRWCAKSFTLAI
jgi:hypothetical protein